MVGHIGGTHRTEENGIKTLELLHAILGHHAAGLLIIVTAPRKPGKVKLEPTVQPCHFLQHAYALPDDLRSNAVTGDDGYFVCLHCNASFMYHDTPGLVICKINIYLTAIGYSYMISRR